MLSEFTPQTAAAKRKAFPLPDQRYYYVFFLGTHEDGRGKGFCSAIVKHFQEMAAKDQLPIWMEATTEYSMKLYLKLGFHVVQEIIIGKGKAAADGTKLVDGAGIPFWGMVWRPGNQS